MTTIDNMPPLPITIVKHQNPFTAAWLENQTDMPGSILACDFYVSGAESAERVTGGYSFGRVVNIDHHATTDDMMRRISSTNLALDRRLKHGPEPEGSVVVINHTDCDSILSSGIISGELPPDSRLGEAAIAADHTGAANTIADVLQELDNIRHEASAATGADSLAETREQFLRYCFGLVNDYLNRGDEALDERARHALVQREQKRGRVRNLVERGDFKTIGEVWFTKLEEHLDGELFVEALPDISVILLSTPGAAPDTWIAKIRLGMAAREGWSLHQLDICSFDPAYGGRWNAGSSRRNGGTSTPVESYAQLLAEAVKRWPR